MKIKELQPRLLALVIAALLSSNAFASISYTGRPDANIPVLKTYGVDVPIRSGLKAVLPQGWTLFLHKTAHLPDTMSWKPGDAWTKALEDLANQNNLAVRMDWSRKTVTLLSAAEAQKEQAELAQVQRAATTPLPSLTPEAAPRPVAAYPAHQRIIHARHPLAAHGYTAIAPATAPAIAPHPFTQSVAALPVAASPAPAVVAPVAPVAPVAAVSPVPMPQPAPVAIARPAPVPLPRPVVAPVVPAIAAQIAQPRNVAFSQVGGSMKSLLERMADHYGYALSWEASDAEIPGPVTLLGVDIAEDAELLQKAVGLASTPVSIEIYRASDVLRVVPRTPLNEPLALMSGPFNGRINNVVLARRQPAPVPAPQVAPAPQTAPAPAQLADIVHDQSRLPVATAAKAAPVAKKVTLSIVKGQSLSTALGAFFKDQGWAMRWTAKADLQAEYPVAIEAANFKQVMAQLLPRLGLVADFYNPSRVVVIRSFDATTN